MDSLQLGASLYIPATHPDLVTVGNRVKYPNLRSVIYCTEDAVHVRHLSTALKNLDSALELLQPEPSILRFIRVRNPEVLREILKMKSINNIDGFVLPKVTSNCLDDYFKPLFGTKFKAMVTLETKECFEATKMINLRDELIDKGYDKYTLSLRIGGNDLLNIVGMRRVRNKTIYETPIGQVISNLVGIFKPYGFQLSAPVFEYMNDPATLQREIEQDLAHGLVGKTAIHPQQIDQIEGCYQVCPMEVEQATYLLSSDAKAVHKMHDAMLEVSTHSAWAQQVMKRADIFGVAA